MAESATLRLATDLSATLAGKVGDRVDRALFCGAYEITNGDELTTAGANIEGVEFIRDEPIDSAELGDDVVLFALEVEAGNIESAEENLKGLGDIANGGRRRGFGRFRD